MMNSIFSDIWTAVTLLLTADFWKRLAAGLKEICRVICMLLCRLAKGRLPPRPPVRNDCCIQLPPDVYKRADPLIYSQYYLMAQGLAVTWDNPDIDIFDGTVLVTGPLKRDHTYRVRVRIWNGSYDAPAVGVGVALSYLSFGAQTVSNPIPGSSSVNLGAKGTIDCPAFAELTWTTPSTEGHYCLQAQLTWGDDANPDNNLGQKNVNVAAVQSPAEFSFLVRNEASVARRFRIEADTYALPRLRPCGEEAPRGREQPKTRLAESKDRWVKALGEQGYGHFPVPDDWAVRIVPDALSLGPREEAKVEVMIEPMDPAFRGSKTFNVHTFAVAE